jgi:DNA-binding MarR family transcriptional regulator
MSDDKRRRTPWPAMLTAHAVLIGAAEKRLAAAGLPELGWYDVLWALEQAPGRRLRMHELADRCVISRSNLTRLIDRLENEGLVKRDRDAEDRRGAFAVITRAGLAMRQRMWPIYAEAINDLFSSHIDAREGELLVEIFERVIRAARD